MITLAETIFATNERNCKSKHYLPIFFVSPEILISLGGLSVFTHSPGTSFSSIMS